MKILSFAIALAISFLSFSESAMASAPQIGNGSVGSVVATATLLAVVSYSFLRNPNK
jgi:hypothetical protein